MRFITVTIAIVLAATAVPAFAQDGPDGAGLYRQNCARCHDGNMPTALLPVPIQALPASYIYEALMYFYMQRNAASLSKDEKRAVAEHVSGGAPGSLAVPLDQISQTAYCVAGAGRVADPLAGPTWNGWSPERGNARFQSAAGAGLTAGQVGDLELKWAFGLPGVSAASLQATIAGGRVFIPSSVGLIYTLDAASGCIQWIHENEVGVRATMTVGPAEGGAHLYVGDVAANVAALDAETGEVRWRVNVDDHPDARVTGAPTLHDGRLYVPVSSLEEGTATWPAYECCTFRGSIVALDAATGDRVWKTHTIAEEPRRTDRNSAGAQRWGPSGAAVWSSPTLDPERNVMYVTTGDSYSDPPAPESDAIMALAMDTGDVRWVTQTTPGDAFTVACVAQDEADRAGCPDSNGPDVDYGSAAVLTTDGNGRRLLLAGQKSGVMYAVNPDDGAILWESRVSDGGVLGGIEWGFAADNEVVYASISDVFEKAPGEAGGLVALLKTSGDVVWEAPPFQDTCGSAVGCHTGQPGAVTAIPGVIFSGSLDGHLRAHETETGRVIWDVDTVRDYDTVNGVAARGGSLNGPGATVAGGMVYVSSGYSTLGYMPGNVLLAFSVNGQ